MDLNKEKTSVRAIYWVFVLILIGLAFRWIGLGDRPLHHDESIHVMFGRYFFDFPDANYYKYNPEYHGPLLYNMLRFVYETLGDYEWSARALMSVMGSALIFLPWILRKYLSEVTLIGLTAVLSLSPTLVYWSRFVREDMFVITGMAMMLYGVFNDRPSTRSFWVLLGIVFQFASKENSYVTMALFWAYFVVDYLARRFFDGQTERYVDDKKANEPLPFSFFAPIPFAIVILLHLGMKVEGETISVENFDYMHLGALLGAGLLAADIFGPQWKGDFSNGSLVARLFNHISRYRWEFVVSFAISALLFCYLFSAGFRYPEGILDGLYRKGITYWIEKHNVERIKGPFLFHFYQLSWYEFLFMVAVLWQAIHFYLRQGIFIRIAGVALLLFAIVVGVANIPAEPLTWPEPSFILWKKLKLKDWFDVVGAIILLVHPFIVTGVHLAKKEWKLAFWGYLFTFSFLTYSYLGEKVPWLSTYPFLAGLIYIAMYVDSELKEGRVSFLISEISFASVLKISGFVLLILGIWFVLEDYARWDTLNPGTELVSLQKVLEANRLFLGIGLILLGLGFADERLKIVGPVHGGRLLLVVYVLFTARITYFANFETKLREIGFISQVHTTHELIDVANKIRNEIKTHTGGHPKTVLVAGDGVWPLTWYFRDLPSYKFSATDAEKPTFDYIFQDTEAAVPEGFDAQRLNLRGWWVPDYRLMTLKRFLGVSTGLRVWGENGYSYINFLTKK